MNYIFESASSCSIDNDCSDAFICSAGSCIRNGVFPLRAIDVFATILVCFLNSLGSAAGVAEAGLLSSYLVIMMGYTVKDAITCSYAIGLGGALGNFVNVAFIRHAETNKPVINYEINLIVIPMLMFGVYIGVNVQKVIPNLAIIMVLFCVLSLTFYKFLTNLLKQLKREKMSPEEIAHLDEHPKEQDPQELTRHLRDSIHENMSDMELERREQRLFPWEKYREIFIVILGIVAFGLLRGGSARPSPIGIPYCGVAYWLALLAILIFFLGVFWRCSHLVRSWQRERQARGILFRTNELVFSKKRVIQVGLLALMAGVVGATIAIGGALILTPFFLDWGLPPRDTSYTCALFVILTLFNTTFQQLLFGGLNLQEVAWFGGIAFILSFTSSRVVGAFVRKTGKQSVLLILLLIVCSFSIITEIYVLVGEAENGFSSLIAFHSEC